MRHLRELFPVIDATYPFPKLGAIHRKYMQLLRNIISLDGYGHAINDIESEDKREALADELKKQHFYPDLDRRRLVRDIADLYKLAEIHCASDSDSDSDSDSESESEYETETESDDTDDEEESDGTSESETDETDKKDEKKRNSNNDKVTTTNNYESNYTTNFVTHDSWVLASFAAFQAATVLAQVYVALRGQEPVPFRAFETRVTGSLSSAVAYVSSAVASALSMWTHPRAF